MSETSWIANIIPIYIITQLVNRVQHFPKVQAAWLNYLVHYLILDILPAPKQGFGSGANFREAHRLLKVEIKADFLSARPGFLAGPAAQEDNPGVENLVNTPA